MNLVNQQYSNTGTQYHIRCKSGDVGRYVLLPGDPARIDLIASLLDDVREIAYNREHRTITGFYRDVKVSATSTGMGCPSTAIAVEELGRIGVTHFIRVGSTAAMQDFVTPGDLIIASGAHGLDGTTRHYVDGDPFSCIASFEVVSSLVHAAKHLGACYHVGPVLVHDAFYNEKPEFLSLWRERNVLTVEMESSVIYTIAMLRGYKAGSVLLAGDNLFSPNRSRMAADQEAQARRMQHLTALEAIYAMDTETKTEA